LRPFRSEGDRAVDHQLSRRMPPRIVIFGGTGFLGVFPPIDSILIEGSHLCRAAIQRQCQVTSISRSGGRGGIDPQTPASTHQIYYQKANIFSPEQYREFLTGADAVIYSAGMLLEGDYKSLARGEFNIGKVMKLLRHQEKNPLTRSRGYDSLNRDGGTASPWKKNKNKRRSY
jgi:hypothetical protein